MILREYNFLLPFVHSHHLPVPGAGRMGGPLSVQFQALPIKPYNNSAKFKVKPKQSM